MKTKKSVFIINCSYLSVFLMLLSGCEPSAQTVDFASEQNSHPTTASSIPLPENRDYLPEFELPALDGDHFNSEQLKGQVTLINFWATWCAPCRVEIPDLIALQEEIGSDQFTVLGISMDTDEVSYVKEFAESLEINYPVLLDDGELAEAIGGVYALPTTFIINKDGKITHRTIGLFPVDVVKEELVEMIAAD